MPYFADEKNAVRTQIIVADDSPAALHLLQATVCKMGFDVLVADDGDAAWKAIEAQDGPMIALLDWMMPGLQGPEICRRTRALSRKYYPYLILVTGRNESGDVIAGLEAGADDYVHKPVNRDELAARLHVAQRIISFHDRLRAAEQRLLRSEASYRTMVESTSALICAHDLQGRILSLNPTALAALGGADQSYLGRNIRDLLKPEYRPQFDTYLGTILEKKEAKGQMAFTSATGREAVWSYSNLLVHDESGVPYIMGHAQDMTEWVRMEEALKNARESALEFEKQLSRTDPLTKLGNSRAFLEVAEEERLRASRYSRALSLLYLDLDNFKYVNDRFGHEKGDKVLTMIGDILRSERRASDYAARLGGDEFALILPETGHAGAAAVAAKLRDAVKQAMQQNGWPVTVSIGAATFTSVPDSCDEMVRCADHLMYESKRNGKDQISTSLDPAAAQAPPSSALPDSSLTSPRQ
jgi:diguanylate cyclase (GGDEF)-like protein/PAS domain S-box-containing protein